LPSNRIKNWDKDERPPVNIKFPGILQQHPSLKEKISKTIYRLRTQQNKLENAVMKMQRHDRELFDKCVSSQMTKDSARATMYANECAEVRKLAAITLRTQLALEQVSL